MPCQSHAYLKSISAVPEPSAPNAITPVYALKCPDIFTDAFLLLCFFAGRTPLTSENKV